MSWRDWLYETDPQFRYPDLKGDLSVPAPPRTVAFPDPLGKPDEVEWVQDPVTGQMTPRKKAGVQDRYTVSPPEPGYEASNAPRIDVSGGQSTIPVEFDRERTGKKTGLGKALLDILPRMLEGGIAAGATQNVAGGGPTDFFRAAAASRESLDRRDANKMQMQNYYEQQARAEELRRSQMEENRAQSELYRAQAQKAAQPAPGFTQKYDTAYAKLIEIGTPPQEAAKQAAIIASGGSLQHMRPEKDAHEGMARVMANHPLTRYIRPDANGEYWIPKEHLDWQPKEPKAEPAEKLGRVVRSGNQWVEIKPDGKGGVKMTPTGAPAPDPTPRAEAKKKPVSRASLLAVKQKRDTGFKTVEDAYKKAEKAAMDGVDWVDRPEHKGWAADTREKLYAKRELAKAKLAEAKAARQQGIDAVVAKFQDDVNILMATQADDAESAVQKEDEKAVNEAAKAVQKAGPAPALWQGHGFKSNNAR